MVFPVVIGMGTTPGSVELAGVPLVTVELLVLLASVEFFSVVAR